jgi:hypothetical protein
MKALLIFLAALILIGGKKESSPPVLLSATKGAGGWTITSRGGPVQMQGTDPLYFDIPQNGNANYVFKSGSVRAGQTITLRFVIEGTGTLAPVDPNDQPPATMRVFAMDRNAAYGNGRWWGPVVTTLVTGEYTVTVPVDDKWTGIYGEAVDVAAFSKSVYVGFTLGGKFFAGHGIYVKQGTGSMRFVLKEYRIN